MVHKLLCAHWLAQAWLDRPELEIWLLQATESWLVTNGISKTKPNNVWTHGPNQSVHAASSSSAQQAPLRGAAGAKAPNKWAKQPGQLAQQTKVLQDAWGKP